MKILTLTFIMLASTLYGGSISQATAFSASNNNSVIINKHDDSARSFSLVDTHQLSCYGKKDKQKVSFCK